MIVIRIMGILPMAFLHERDARDTEKHAQTPSSPTYPPEFEHATPMISFSFARLRSLPVARWWDCNRRQECLRYRENKIRTVGRTFLSGANAITCPRFVLTFLEDTDIVLYESGYL